MSEPDTDDAGEPRAVLPTARMFAWARNSAAYRLTKSMMTEKQLRDAIIRKARQKFEAIEDEHLQALAAEAVRFGYQNKALDDRTFAEVSARSGARSGKSRRVIAQKLAIKGVDRELAREALSDTDDFQAAIVHARKRRLGPFRRADVTEPNDDKEMASFGRAGFSFEIGRRVLDLTLEEAEEIMFNTQRL
jgi:regulatory protein